MVKNRRYSQLPVFGGPQSWVASPKELFCVRSWLLMTMTQIFALPTGEVIERGSSSSGSSERSW